ncbi:MAG: cyclic nucleotide-binding domain-containing protein [Nitrospirota bacterium]|jgi:CRP/FNR family cyclic AMP-dependent transcriptional regulator
MAEGELGRMYADGEAICKEGEKGNAMYVIQSGKVQITKKTPTGQMNIATLGSGEIFGEMALFDKLERSATVTASGSARVLSIDRKKLFRSISRDPTLVFKVLESMSHRIRSLDEQLAELKKSKLDADRMCLSVEESCAVTLEKARNIISADNGSIMLLEEDTKDLVIKAAFGTEAGEKVRLTAGEGLAGAVLSSASAEMVNNVSLDTRFKPGAMRLRSILCAPLKCGDEVFGVINLSNSSERLFSLEDLKVLDSLASYASIAIEQARSFARLDGATEAFLRRAGELP